MICLHSIPSGEEWVLVLHSSQHSHENSEDLRESPDYCFFSDYDENGKPLNCTLWRKHYHVNLCNVSVWKRVSLKEAEISC